MPGIFISYRRADAAAYAGRLADHLKRHFAASDVFHDVVTIEPGSKFEEAIENALQSCAALVAIIGPRWLTVEKDGRRRLDDPDDYTRQEIVAALRRDIRVIPVLVGGASMPSLQELPDDLRALAKRNAFEVSDTRWEFDVSQLVKTLERAVSQVRDEQSSTLPRVRRGLVSRSGAGILILIIVLGGALTTLRLWPRAARSIPPLSSSEQQQSASLAAPIPLEPSCGATIPFPENKHLLMFRWTPVDRASNYTVEVDCFGCGGTTGWVGSSGSSWHLRSGLGFRSPIYSSEVHLSSGPKPLRWRVWAVDADNRTGQKSTWCQFAFVGGPAQR
jgi:TIR domain